MPYFDESLKPKISQEIITEAQQEYKLIGSFKLTPGLKLYKLNLSTLEYKEVTITKTLAIDIKGQPVKNSKTNFEANCIYFQSLNLKNAKKHAMKELEKLMRKNIEKTFRPKDNA